MCFQIGQGSGMQALKLVFDLPDFLRMLPLEIRLVIRESGGKHEETEAKNENAV